MCCSDAFSVSTGSVFVSGVVAMWSVDLQLDDVVLDSDREGVHGDVGGQGLRLARPQIEQRSVAGALDGAVLGIQLPLGGRAIGVAAAVLEREQLAVAVEDADLEVLPLDDARGTGRELRERADVDGLRHGGEAPAIRIRKIRCGRSELYRAQRPVPVERPLATNGPVDPGHVVHTAARESGRHWRSSLA